MVIVTVLPNSVALTGVSVTLAEAVPPPEGDRLELLSIYVNEVFVGVDVTV